MAKIDFSKITPENGALHDVAELLFLQLFTEENQLSKFVQPYLGVQTGDKLAGVGGFGPMGKKLTKSCGNPYDNSIISAQEKEWALGKWGIREQICIDEIEATLVRNGFKSGTDIADLQGSDYLDKVLIPLLEKAVIEALWRMVWLGDTAAKSAANGGIITDGLNLDLFNICDGLFKRLATITATNPAQRVTIAANAENTYALQRSALKAQGVAQKLLDEVIDAMSPALKQADNRAILLTDSVATALSRDIRNNNKGSEPQWQSIFTGVEVAQYDGQNLFRIAMWDNMIQAFNDAGGHVVNPHRVVATTLDNLLMGTSSTAEIATINSWFDQKDDINYLKVNDTIDTLIWQDDLIVYGY